MTQVKDRILETADKLGLTMSAEFVPWSKSRNAGEKYPSLNWKITLSKGSRPILTTDYGAGSGHCPSYRQGDNSMHQREAIAWECEHGREAAEMLGGFTNRNAKPILPDLADVLYSLASEAEVLDYSSYEQWAPELGYDPDSRKGEAIYRACLEIGLKLRNALREDGLKELREAVQDYLEEPMCDPKPCDLCRALIQDLEWVRQCLRLRSEGGLRPVRDPQDWKTLLFVIDADLEKVRELCRK